MAFASGAMKFKVVFTALLLSCLWSFVRANSSSSHSFIIKNDLFLKDGVPFRILGGDLHYFRVHPQLWKDRLLRVKALGLNTIQTYVPWNLHEPRPGLLNFNGSADLLSFLKMAQDLDLLVMLRIGPYICGEWDFGGFPAWLLELDPAVRLRSSEEQYLAQVDNWWKKLLPMVAPKLFSAGGPVIMIQIENEYGSYANDKKYLKFLQNQARLYLGDDVIMYTTDGAGSQSLRDGSLSEDGVFAGWLHRVLYWGDSGTTGLMKLFFSCNDIVPPAIDFPTGSNPAAAFALQKRYNPSGMSPPLSAEFYTGWLTHWGENLAQTDAESTAEALDDILQLNASVVLYMVHGGTNFGFYSGANTGATAADYQPDITSYDYNAPIGEAGDVSNAKYQEIRKVLSKYVDAKLPEPPPLPQRTAYGEVIMTTMVSLFDILEFVSTPPAGIKLKWPVPMEHLGQGSGFILYRSRLPASVRPGSELSVVEVYDRAQVFVGNTTSNRIFIGLLERGSSNSLTLPAAAAVPGLQLDILVENMGRVNYGPFMGENKGITEAVLLDEDPILGWNIHPMGLESVEALQLNSKKKTNPNYELQANATKIQQTLPLTRPLVGRGNGPVFYEGTLTVTEPSDTFMSLRGWSKGVAFVNGFNLGRFWPSKGPQCSLYIPGLLLHLGENKVIILELESSSPVQAVEFMASGDFTCGLSTLYL